jgi:hypothetical protein
MEGMALAAAILVLAVIGPFGTFTELSFPGRLAYWGVIVTVNALQVELATWAAFRFLPRRWPWWATAALACAAAAVPATFEVMGLEGLFRPGRHGDEPWFKVYFFVLVLTLALGLPLSRLALSRLPAPVAAGVASAIPAADLPFFRRLPERLGRDLLCLEMEDHYLRVHTARGSDLILLRMKDAVAELAGADGLQVHRSWWVAARAVVGFHREGDKVVLALSNGLAVPVSRSFLPAVRRAGWLAREPS